MLLKAVTFAGNYLGSAINKPGGGVLPNISHIGVLPKGVGFCATFCSENGCRRWSFWSGIGNVFQGNHGSVRTYLLYLFQMSKKEREICEIEMNTVLEIVFVAVLI